MKAKDFEKCKMLVEKVEKLNDSIKDLTQKANYLVQFESEVSTEITMKFPSEMKFEEEKKPQVLDGDGSIKPEFLGHNSDAERYISPWPTLSSMLRGNNHVHVDAREQAIKSFKITNMELIVLLDTLIVFKKNERSKTLVELEKLGIEL